MLQSTAPLYVLLLGSLMLAERFARRDVGYLLAVALGTIGCLAGRPAPTSTAPDPALRNTLGVVCSITWAFTLMALRFVERERCCCSSNQPSTPCGRGCSEQNTQGTWTIVGGSLILTATALRSFNDARVPLRRSG